MIDDLYEGKVFEFELCLERVFDVSLVICGMFNYFIDINDKFRVWFKNFNFSLNDVVILLYCLCFLEDVKQKYLYDDVRKIYKNR